MGTGHWKALLQVAPLEASFLALEGICAALLGQLAYYYALKFGDVSRVAPVVAAFPVVAMLLAFVVLGEQITATKVIAAVLITAGVVLLR